MSEYKCSCGHAIKNHGAVGCQCGCPFTKSDLLFAEMKQRAEAAEARVTELEAVCAYWLRDARFLVSDYSADGEYRRAVHALENGRLE